MDALSLLLGVVIGLMVGTFFTAAMYDLSFRRNPEQWLRISLQFLRSKTTEK